MSTSVTQKKMAPFQRQPSTALNGWRFIVSFITAVMSFRHGVVPLRDVADHLATAAFQVGSAQRGGDFQGLTVLFWKGCYNDDWLLMIVIRCTHYICICSIDIYRYIYTPYMYIYIWFLMFQGIALLGWQCDYCPGWDSSHEIMCVATFYTTWSRSLCIYYIM